MGVHIRYEYAKRLADAFSLLTAVLTFDPNGHVAGVILQEVLEDAVFTSGAAVLPSLRGMLQLQGWSMMLALWLKTRPLVERLRSHSEVGYTFTSTRSPSIFAS
ncbi:MAG: hypothetical protein ACFB4J_01890 [Elainellaceae cyanobacterium]